MHIAIDVHSHMLCEEWLALFKAHSGPRFSIRQVTGGKDVIHADGVAFMTPTPGMFDYAARFKAMDEAGVGMAVLSLTGPNVYWGGPDISARAARVINESYAEACRAWPERLRWLASLPLQHPDLALAELDRAVNAGALGVMALANIGGAAWTDPLFAPVGTRSTGAACRCSCTPPSPAARTSWAWRTTSSRLRSAFRSTRRWPSRG